MPPALEMSPDTRIFRGRLPGIHGRLPGLPVTGDWHFLMTANKGPTDPDQALVTRR